MELAFGSIESVLFGDFSNFIDNAVGYVLLGLFVFGIIGILWGLFKKATDDRYPLHHMIQTIFLNIILIALVIYVSNYLGKSLSDTVQMIFS